MRRTRNLLSYFLVFILTVGGAPAHFKDLKLPKKIFPVKTDSYEITQAKPHPKVEGVYIYTVLTDRGNYEVAGLVTLKKRLHEIGVLSSIDEYRAAQGSATSGAKESIKDTGRGLKKLFTKPKDSAKGVGKATKKLGRSIGGMFRKKEAGEKTSWGEKMLGSTKRDVATDLKVDVYSRNEYLQEELTSIAKSQMKGKGVVFIGTLLIPVGLVVSVAVTAGGLNQAADKLVNGTSKPELYRLNKEALIATGLSDREAKDLLNTPHLTPREATYLRFYLEVTQDLEGIDGARKSILKAGSDVEAKKRLGELQMIVEEGKKPWKITVLPEGLLLESKKGIILVTADDYLDNSGRGTQFMDKVFSMGKGKKSEVWVGGKTTLGFNSAAILKGVKVRSMLLLGEEKS